MQSKVIGGLLVISLHFNIRSTVHRILWADERCLDIAPSRTCHDILLLKCMVVMPMYLPR